MENKIKVWNQEVSCCSKCLFYNCNDSGCNYIPLNMGAIDLDLDVFNEIHTDCPFKQSITKEVIESFGFNFHEDYYHDKTTPIYKNSTYYLKYNPKDNSLCILKGDYVIFTGTINNPEELKFILKSLNIV